MNMGVAVLGGLGTTVLEKVFLIMVGMIILSIFFVIIKVIFTKKKNKILLIIGILFLGYLLLDFSATLIIDYDGMFAKIDPIAELINREGLIK